MYWFLYVGGFLPHDGWVLREVLEAIEVEAVHCFPLLRFIFIFNVVCNCVNLCMGLSMFNPSTGRVGGQNRAWGPPEM